MSYCIRLATLLLGIVLLLGDARLATLPIAVPEHPRILWTAGQERAVHQRIRQDSLWQKLHNEIMDECDRLTALPPVKPRKVGRQMMDSSREVLRRVFFLSYGWRMTRRPAYLKRAEQELLAVAGYDWNSTHFLGTAELMIATAIGYDWLFHHLSPATRRTLSRAIVEKGITPSLNVKESRWLRVAHNWNQVCNTGVVFGAMAIYDQQPDLARHIIDRSLQSVRRAMAKYGPNGAYPEGYSYWGFGTAHNVLLVSALEKLFGTTFGLPTKNFMQTGHYVQQLTGPTGRPFNYSDCDTNGHLQPALFWFAAQKGNPSLIWTERYRLLHKKAHDHVKAHLLPAAMIWGTDLALDPPAPPAATLWIGQGDNAVAAMRTSWRDTNAIHVGLKAGSPQASHAHMDVGSFVMDADGVRWSMDPGWQEYNTLEKHGFVLSDYSQTSKRWWAFRNNNFSHSTLTVNGQLQRATGRANIVVSANEPTRHRVSADLSSLYEPYVRKVVRNVTLADKRYVLVQDDLETAHRPAQIRWAMFTPARVRLLGKTRAQLEKDGKTLLVQVEQPANVTLTTWPTAPTTYFDAPNPGTTLLGFIANVPPRTKTTFSVKLLPISQFTP